MPRSCPTVSALLAPLRRRSAPLGEWPDFLAYAHGTDADMTPEDWRAWRREERADYRRQEAA